MSEENSLNFDEVKHLIFEMIENLNTLMSDFYTEINNTKQNGGVENSILMNIFHSLPLVEIENSSKCLSINLDIISRNKMKCAFFGKTSNGKSAVINAILNEKLLPSSFGRTTSCFIKVEGCDDAVGYLIDKDKNRRNCDDIKNIANEMDQERYEITEYVSLFWPKNKCSLLRNDVQFLDSPGVDYSEEHKDWIKNYCQDADVFVYVMDACSTISESEKNFFESVNAIIAKPNIFVVMNKWDICEDEISAQKLARVKLQHVSTIKNFFQGVLAIDLDFQERIFFVSAKEVLEDCSSLESKSRREEFNRFVDVIQQEMSQEAMIRKFKRHLDKAGECLKLVMDSINAILNAEVERDADSGNDEEIKRRLADRRLHHFQEMRGLLIYVVYNECASLVSFVIMHARDSTRIKDKIEEFLHGIMRCFEEKLGKTICCLLEEIRAALVSWSRMKVDHLVMDEYLPSTSKENIDGPCLNSEAVRGASNEAAGHFRTDIGSAIAFALPLTVELDVIFSKEKLHKYALKRDVGDLKERTMDKLVTKVNRATGDLLIKTLEQHQRKIESVTDVLVARFVSDHREACRVVASVRGMRHDGEALKNTLAQRMSATESV